MMQGSKKVFLKSSLVELSYWENRPFETESEKTDFQKN